MREIKFRAWDKKHNFMDTNVCFLSWLKGGLKVEGAGVSIGNGWATVNPYIDGMRGVSPDAILMQYTGLKDKNGVEVYEGDVVNANIIRFSTPTMGRVVFCEEYATYVNRNLSGDTFLWKLNDVEIIGNIYENPELMEDNNDNI